VARSTASTTRTAATANSVDRCSTIALDERAIRGDSSEAPESRASSRMLSIAVSEMGKVVGRFSKRSLHHLFVKIGMTVSPSIINRTRRFGLEAPDEVRSDVALRLSRDLTVPGWRR